MAKFTTILWDVIELLDISPMEYIVCDTIFQLSTNPNSTLSGWCYESRKKMAERFGITTRTLQNMINRLVKKNLIIKDERTNYLRPTTLWCKTYQRVKDFPIGTEKISDGDEKISDGGGEKISPNKYSINKDIYNESNNNPQTPNGDTFDLKTNNEVEPEKRRRQSIPRAKFEPDLSRLWDEFSKELIQSFIDYRAGRKKPYKTQIEIDVLIDNLLEFSEGDPLKAEQLIKYSIAGGYPAIYKPKNFTNGKSQQSSDEYKRTVVNIAEKAIAGAEKSRLEREERERRIRESSPGY